MRVRQSAMKGVDSAQSDAFDGGTRHLDAADRPSGSACRFEEISETEADVKQPAGPP
jgi:hypothetical protein